MERKKNYWTSLLDKYLSGNATAKEKTLVGSWYLDLNKDKKSLSHQELEEEFHLGLQNINKAINRRQRLFYVRISTAAAAILLIAGSLFFHYRAAEKPLEKKVAQLAKPEDFKSKVMLTLSNGQQISLNELQLGSTITEEGTVLSKSSTAELSYLSAQTENINAYNAIQTPIGLSFRVNLPDGSRVWINSMSKLKYPLHFNNEERIVELEGEAYFEIAKNNKADGSRKPFKVISKNQTVEVLGTHFNVRAYEDERLDKTTLLEGAVRVHAQNQAKMLRPGEQATYVIPRNTISISEVNPEYAVAWKEGYFSFNDVNVVTMMNELKRWYDIEVVYQSQSTDKKISGTFSRTKNISELLLAVEDLGDYKFKIEGRRIVVTPN